MADAVLDLPLLAQGPVVTPAYLQHIGGTNPSTQTASAVLTGTAALTKAATAGNLLVFVGGFDKNPGTVTVKDNISAGTSSTNGAGWTVHNVTATNASVTIAWKVALGGETTITEDHTTSQASGQTLAVDEWADARSGTWTEYEYASHPNDGTLATTWSNTTSSPTSSAEGLAISAWSVDSGTNTIGATMSYSNGYVEQHNNQTGGGRGSVFSAWKPVSVGTTLAADISYSGGSAAADEWSAAVVVIARAASLTPVSTTRSTTWAVGSTVTTTRATTWNVNATLASVSTTRSTTWNVAAAPHYITPPPISTGTVHQGANTSATILMSTPATAGSTLVAVMAFDKTNGGTPTGPTGAGSPKATYTSASVSMSLWVWQATGGESSLSFSWTTSTGASGWAAEYAADSGFTVGTAVTGNSGATAVNTQAVGPYVVGSSGGTALAFFANDSSTTAWATTPPTSSAGWTDRYINADSSSLPGLYVVDRSVVPGQSVSNTFTAPTSDQTVAFLIGIEGTAPTVGPATIESCWSGAATTTTEQIAIRVTGGGTDQHRIAYSTSSAMTSPSFSSWVTPDARGVSKHSLSGLTAGTRYYYRVEVGSFRYSGGQFKTMPTGQTSFSFAFHSCRSTLNASSIYSTIRTRDPLFYHFIGDIQYEDTNTTNPDDYRANYNTIQALPGFGGALANLSTWYVWDDHDFAGNNSNASSTGASTHEGVYRERVPHGTLPSSNGAVYQTFTAGRVRFIMLDTRSQRVPGTTMLGSEQLTWLQGLLAAETLPLTFIMSSVPWVSSATTEDNWGSFATERSTIAGWITASATKAVMYSGDMHALAADDGTNSAGGIPALQAAPMGRSNSFKGGPYSQGFYPNIAGGDPASVEHYGWVDITDNGSTITWAFTGIDDTGVTRISLSQTVSALTTSVSTSRSTTWDVKASVSATKATTWAVRSAVSTTKATTWTTRARVTSSRPTTWNVAQHASDTLPLRGMFYYPWFSGGSDPSYPGSWNQTYNSVLYKPASQYHPTRGHYNSGTTAVIDAHIADLLYAKVDVGISSWWGRTHVTNTNFASILARSVGTGLKWCVYYEPEGDKNTHDPTNYDPYNPTAAQIAVDLTYFQNNYFDHPNYLWVNGKPVVFGWGNGADPSATPPVVGDETSNPPQRWADAEALAGVDIFFVPKLYTGFATNVPQPDGWHQYGPASAVLRHAGYYTNLSPGFWHFAYEANPTLPFLARLSDATWRSNIATMLANGDDWMLVTSFNEWGEGTAVEATDGNTGRGYTGSGWGSLYLDALAADGAGLGSVSTTRSSTWDVDAQVSATKATTWTVRTPVTTTRSTTYGVLSRVTTTRATSWNALAPLTITRPTTWGALASVSTTRSTTWNATQGVSTTRATTWTARALVLATKSTNWETRAAITQSRSTSWVVQSLVSASRSTTWNVAGVLSFVQTTRSTTWVTRSAVSVPRVASWSVLGGVSTPRTTSWAVLGALTASRSTSWVVRAVVSASRSTTWNVAVFLGSVSTTRGTTWTVYAVVASTRTATWNVRQSVSVIRVASWDTLAARVAGRSTTWGARATVGLTRVTSWAVRGWVTTTRTALWSQEGRVLITRSTLWRVKGRTGPAPVVQASITEGRFVGTLGGRRFTAELDEE